MTFRDQLTWATLPLIVSAPMGGFAGPELAAAVSSAGGLGMIGAMLDPTVVGEQLEQAATLLTATQSNGNLPIGVGLLLFALGERRSEMVQVLAKRKPAVIWLFAETQLSDYSVWTKEIRESLPDSQVWIQTGSVTGALEIARSAMPDVLVMQGTDAGGHGWEKGASIISLLPETRDALEREDLHIALAASGGIADARGAAAALTLGAEAVVLGTRFLASEEIMVHPMYQHQILNARDGGQDTVRAKVFDELRGPNIWPQAYDGRALLSKSFEEHVAGVDLDQIRSCYATAVMGDDKGWGDSRRAAVWSGTGVGLVNSVLPASEIVRQVRDGVRTVLNDAHSRC
ncbi:hypothetical protein AB5N19_00225 [Seiridium cardinale]